MISPASRWIWFGGLTIALVACALLSLLTGELGISASDSLQILTGRSVDAGVSNPDLKQSVLLHIRLPRVVLAIFTGATLAMCGAVMQGLFRNPLADPGLLGISAGCALGAALVVVLGGHWLIDRSAINAVWLLPSGAFIGGLLTTWLVYSLGRSGQRTDVSTMLLAGVAISAIAGAGTSALKFIADDEALRGVVFWLMGDLGSSDWSRLGWVLPIQAAALLAMWFYRRTLNALLLGEAEAQYLGFNIEQSKRVLILLVALSVGISVSLAGVISFIGLIVPHLLRRVIGADHCGLLPASALLGAVLVLCADWLARTLIAPTEIPIGILTALTGGPFFIWLLVKTRYRYTN